MIRTVKPKNARSKRALENKEGKIIENVKTALFIPTHTSNQSLHDITIDLSNMKKPFMKKFTKKNQNTDLLPFDKADNSNLEFFSEKNDASIIILSSNNKKRPNNLTFVRFFEYKVYDIIELQVIKNFKLMQDFKKLTYNVGLKPMFSIQGDIFNTNPTYMHIKSVFMDLYKGDSSSQIQDVKALQYVISLSVDKEYDETLSNDLPNVLFRVYKIRSYKSSNGSVINSNTGKLLPRIELEEIGPRLDFKVGREQLPSADMQKEALKKPRQAYGANNANNFRVQKNIEMDVMGDKLGRIHMGKQDLSGLQTRKMKGLKPRFDQNNLEAQEEAYINNSGEEDFGEHDEEAYTLEQEEEILEGPSRKKSKK
ncbi:hypothetical protein ACO0SA_004585 [Hanseniaspora valbyensis]